MRIDHFNSNRTQEVAVWLLFGCIVGFLFWPGIYAQQIPAFRDGYHFYWPQAVWLDQQIQVGNYFPSWNPDECWGVSVIGQPSSGLFYPLRAVWLVSFLPLATRYSLFMATHVVIAAIGMRLASKRFDSNEQTAILAGISYGLSAAVLCQHFNLIYLCSASWIGFAIAGMHRLLDFPPKHNRGRLSSAGLYWLPLACSMMLLGGDPQTCYNTLIILFLAICYRSLKVLFLNDGDNQGTEKAQIAGGLFGRFLFVSLITLCLTAVQWWPAWQWSLQSDRLTNNTETISDSSLSPSMLAALNRERSTNPRVDYGFSHAPWHFITCVVPTLGGHYLPRNTRWFDILAAEPRMWLPSLYFGILPFAGISLYVFRRMTKAGRASQSAISTRYQWLLLLALSSALFSMGNYSIGWLIQQSLGKLGADLGQLAWLSHLNPYYLLSWFPGYSGFRYPSKWNVWFVAACCLLAAHSWREFSQLPLGSKVRTRRGLVIIGLLLTGVGCTIYLVSSFEQVVVTFQLALDRYALDHWLGIPNAKASLQLVSFGLCCPGIVLICWRFIGKGTWTISMLTLADLTLAGSSWLAFTERPELELAKPLKDIQANIWIDGLENRWHPDSEDWTTQSSYLRAQQDFLLGKLGASLNIARVHASQSILSRPQSRLKNWLLRHDTFEAKQPVLDQQLATLGITHRLARSAAGHLELIEVRDARPLCELQIDAAVHKDFKFEIADEITWRWQDSDRLDLKIFANHPITLLVRQFNDGGWRLRHEATDKFHTPKENSFFLYFRLDAGRHNLTLQRKN